MKTDFPDDFQTEFRRFGLEVTDDGVIVTLDPTTGAELVGPDANQRMIHDKRLIAVFQRAGQLSIEFNVCQILTAREQYYPDEEEVVVEHGGTRMTFDEILKHSVDLLRQGEQVSQLLSLPWIVDVLRLTFGLWSWTV